ncbi:sensor histidine kinase [Halostella pelagica]|uniref:sensor histidine kinase n=1 Tax=Halostella pelagica TaxID=2583824 RepID=UPI0010806EED|nr:ATP-binding protein [Halostella pelagica]
MAFQLTPSLLVNIPIFLLAASLAGYGGVLYLREGRRQEVLAFATLMTATALWQLADVLRRLFTDLSPTVWVLHLTLVVLIPLFTWSLVWFALAYTDSSQRRIRVVWGLFFAHVLVIGTMTALNPEFLQTVDGIVYQGPMTVLNVTFERWTVLDRTFTTAETIRNLYHHVIWVVSGAILVQYTLRKRADVAAGQVASLVVGIGTPIVVRRLMSVGVLPLVLPLTDVAFGVLAVCLAVAVFRYRMLDLAAVGRQEFVEGMDDLLVFQNDENEIVYSNPRAREVFEAGEGWRRMDESNFFAPYYDRIEAARGNETTRYNTIELDDASRYFNVKRTTIRTRAGDIGGQVTTFRDVTELEKTNQRLDQFASMVSHDLRTPLNNAVVQTNRLAQDQSDERVEALQEALDRMESMIDDMLRLARAGAEIETAEECSLGELAEEVWGTVETSGVELDCHVEDTTIEADPVRLFQVLENLFRNALDHNDSPLTVQVGTLDERGELASADESVGFFIEDDGCGIPEDQRDVILEHGYTTNRDGSGYGLSIVRHIVDAHDWEIQVTDGTDGGTRFEISGIEAR